MRRFLTSLLRGLAALALLGLLGGAPMPVTGCLTPYAVGQVNVCVIP